MLNSQVLKMIDVTQKMIDVTHNWNFCDCSMFNEWKAGKYLSYANEPIDGSALRIEIFEYFMVENFFIWKNLQHCQMLWSEKLRWCNHYVPAGFTLAFNMANLISSSFHHYSCVYFLYFFFLFDLVA